MPATKKSTTKKVDPTEKPESRSDLVESSHVFCDSIEAGSVNLSQSGVYQVTADEVEINNGAARRVIAKQVNLNTSTAGIVQSTTTSITKGNTLLVNSQKTTVEGNVGLLISPVVSVNNSRNGVIISREVSSKKVSAIFMLAYKTNGPVETIVDRQSVVLFGIFTGVTIALITSLFKQIRKLR